MGKFLTYLFAVLIILLGIPNITFCLSFINDKTIVRGSPNDLEKEELPADYGYKITYNLNDGILQQENKTIYGLFTADFTLNNPTKDGYEFIGWTGSNGDTPQIRVTICTGSSGNLEFTANFALILEAPQVEKVDNTISWNAVENATTYTININGIDRTTTSNLEYNLLEIKDYYIAGNNIIKVKASAELSPGNIFSSDYSNGIVYSLDKLDTPIININEFIVSWDKVDSAKNYQVLIGGFEVATTECSVNLLNYLSYISSSGVTQIRVRALANNEETILNSDFSQTQEFITPSLNKVDLSENGNTLYWDYDENVDYYELYLNYNLCKKIVGLNQIDIMLFATEMITGHNYFQIHAYKAGYKKSVSNYVVYTYINVSELEGLTLEAHFSRTSDQYKLDSANYLDYIQSNYMYCYIDRPYYTDFETYEPYGPDSSEFENNACIQCLNYLVDIDRDLYSLRFVGDDPNQAMYEVLTMINDNYISGRLYATINLSGLIKVKIKSTGEYYIPNDISIKIHYIDMFVNSVFKENCSNYLSDFSTNHNISTTYNIVSNSTEIDYQSINIKLETTDGSCIYAGYNTDKGYYTTSESIDTYLSREELINQYNQNKYKLSNGFYFTVNIAELLDTIKQDADSKILNYISSSTWSGESLENLNLNDLITVHYEDGTEVKFNYDLKCKYYIFTLY